MNLPLLSDEIGLTFHIPIKEREMSTDQMFDVPVQDASWGHATAADAARVANEAGTSILTLIHLNPDLDDLGVLLRNGDRW